MRRYSFDLSSVVITPDIIRSYDCVVIGTNHDAFDYDMMLDNAGLIIDTRGVFRGYFKNVIHA